MVADRWSRGSSSGTLHGGVFELQGLPLLRGAHPSAFRDESRESQTGVAWATGGARVLYWQPICSNPLYHRGDLVDRPRAMRV